jgi:hypothetical protein
VTREWLAGSALFVSGCVATPIASTGSCPTAFRFGDAAKVRSVPSEIVRLETANGVYELNGLYLTRGHLVLSRKAGTDMIWTMTTSLSGDSIILLDDPRRLFLVSFSRLGMGASVLTLDARTSAMLTKQRVGGTTCLHSFHKNDVRAELSGESLLVWGHESSGRYVASIDRESGELRCQRRFDPHECGAR